MQKITPCLWFDTQAEEAVNFYTGIFKNTKIGATARYDKASAEVSGRPEGSVLTIEFTLDGYKFLGLNGGPIFKLTPATSFFITCTTEEEADRLFMKLSEGGEVRMPLATYPFSKKYGRTDDKFGVSRQIFVGDAAQPIMPCLMFVGEQYGKAEEAMNFYTSLFQDARIDFVARYEEGEGDTPGMIKHAKFSLAGQAFIAMESGMNHKFTFTEATSFIIDCATQEEIDMFREKLCEGGTPSQCGWLKDKYGVSRQVVPTVLSTLFTSSDPAKAKRVMEAMLKMTKLVIEDLKNA